MIYLKFAAVLGSALLIIALVAATAVFAVFLAAMGVLSVFIALGCLAGILRNVASDLAPTAMLFAGFFGVFSSLSIASALYIFCPKAIRRFNSAVENIFS
ncbi:MAG: hypothetical protein LBC86_06885 [Oscillospiraceae bacterium]|nr:hypothetical protein [Oscillospiraceae bacterium]